GYSAAASRLEGPRLPLIPTSPEPATREPANPRTRDPRTPELVERLEFPSAPSHLRLPQVLLRRARQRHAILRAVDSRGRHARGGRGRALRRMVSELRIEGCRSDRGGEAVAR